MSRYHFIPHFSFILLILLFIFSSLIQIAPVTATTLNTTESARFAPSAFALTVADTISWFYAAAFGRTPLPNSALPNYGDLEGLTYWTNQYLGGPEAQPQFIGQIYAIADFFVQSPEFQARYPASLTNEQFVTALYANMLERAPDAGGLTFWVGRLDTGISRGTVLADFTNSEENRNSNPLRKAALESFIGFIANDDDGAITPEEAVAWLAANPGLDGALVDLTVLA